MMAMTRVAVKAVLANVNILRKDQQKILSLPEAVFRRCSVKKLFLKIFQNSQENPCARV